jgi:hypothetical protein
MIYLVLPASLFFITKDFIDFKNKQYIKI